MLLLVRCGELEKEKKCGDKRNKYIAWYLKTGCRVVACVAPGMYYFPTMYLRNEKAHRQLNWREGYGTLWLEQPDTGW